MSKDWINHRIAQLRNRAEPEYQQWARKLGDARDTGNLQGMVAKTKIDGNNIVSAPEFELKHWSSIGRSSF